MAILSLDLGTTTGWCARQRSGQITSGTLSFQPKRFEGGGMRYLRFSQWLFEINEILGGIESVYFEEVRRHLGADAAHAYGGFMAHLTAFCEQHKIPYEGIPVGTIKKFATGRGNATKDNMMDFAKSKGLDPRDDNEADAIALLYCVISNHHVISANAISALYAVSRKSAEKRGGVKSCL